MAENAPAPAPRDVGDSFYFKQSKKLQIESEAIEYPDNVKSCIVASSRYGLVFVAAKKAVKIFHVDDILSLDGGTQQQRRSDATIDDCIHQCLDFPSFPVHLALSCDDLILIVCLVNDGLTCARLYDVCIFAQKETRIEAFRNVQLTKDPNNQIIDLLWNPTQSNMFACCLQNGSVTLYEINSTNLKILGTTDIQANSICWSPKGKQLGVGKHDGSVVQLKTNFQPYKTIPAPPGLKSPHLVLSMCWLSSFVFGIAYKPVAESENPIFMIVSTPKNGPVSFTNYEDIMFSSEAPKIPRYFMHHLAEWNVVIMSSNMAVEAAVIGTCDTEKKVWEQWMLEGTGRAELPMFKHNETYAVGMAITFNAKDQLQIGENQFIPPMPVLLLLSTNGILCPFHVMNTNTSAPILIKPAEILKYDEGKAVNPLVGNKDVLTSTPKPAVSSVKTNLVSRMNDLQRSDAAKHALQDQSSVSQSINVSPASTSTALQPDVQQLSTEKTITQSRTKREFEHNDAVDGSRNSTLSDNIKPSFDGSSNRTQDAQPPPSDLTLNGNPTMMTSTPLTKMSEENAKKSADDTVLRVAYGDEILGFQKELSELQSRSSSCKLSLGTDDEIKQLKEKTQTVIDFSDEFKQKAQLLNSKINVLKEIILDSFAMVEESRSIEFRNKDPRYLHLLKSRELDPINKQKICEIRNLHQYVELQLVEVNKMLDHQWQEYMDSKKSTSKELVMPSVETIYRTLSNNNRIIMQQNNELRCLYRQHATLRQNNFGNSVYIPRTLDIVKSKIGDGELAAMADSLLYVHKTPPSQSGIKDTDSFTNKTISPEKQTILRDILSRRKVTPVRSSRPENLSKSRFLAFESLWNVGQSLADYDEDAEIKNESVEKTDRFESSNVPMSQATTNQPIYEDISPPGTPNSNEADVKSKVLSADCQNALRGLRIGGSTSSAFSVIAKSSDDNSKVPVSQGFDQIKRESNKTSATVTDDPTITTVASSKSMFPSFTFPIVITKPQISITPVTPTSTSGFSIKATDNAAASGQSNSIFSFSVNRNESDVAPSFTSSSSETPTVIEVSALTGKCTTITVEESKPEVPVSTKPTEFKFSLGSNNSSFGGTSSTFNFGSTSEASVVVQPAKCDESSDDSSSKNIISSTSTSVTQPVARPLFADSSSGSSIFVTSSQPSNSVFGNTSVPSTQSVGAAATPSVFTTTAAKTTTPSLFGNTTRTPSVFTTTMPSLFGNTTGTPSVFTTTMPSLFGNTTGTSSVGTSAPTVTVTTTTMPSIFGNTTGTSAVGTSAPTVTVTTTTMPSIFGNTTGTSAVGTSAPTITAVATPSVFTTTATTMPSIFGNTAGTSSVFGGFATSSSSIFGNTPATSAQSLFGNTAVATSTASNSGSTVVVPKPSIFGNATATAPTFDNTPATSVQSESSKTVTAPSADVTSSASVFGNASVSTPSLFGNKSATTSLFGNTATTSSMSLFGNTAVTTSASLFGKTTEPSTVFGSTDSNQREFGVAAVAPSSTSFGSAGFGQQSSFSQPAFGQSSASNTGTTFGFVQSTEPSGGLFNTAIEFGGLGGKPSAENASKNVFGGSSFDTGANQNATGLFGQTSSGFSQSIGSFGATQGAVGQTGFGGFSQGSPQKPGTSAFGGPATFGSSPTASAVFGGSPAFGGVRPVFGGSPLSSGDGLFGSAQNNTPPTFGSTTNPTFGSLAAQESPAPPFGDMTQQNSSLTFGSIANQSATGFGSGFDSPTDTGFGFGSPSTGFGTANPSQSSFGAPTDGGFGSVSPNSFSQWRT